MGSNDDLEYDDRPDRDRRRRDRDDDRDDDGGEPARGGGGRGTVFIVLMIVGVIGVVVCCVVGILASLMLPAMTKVREKANRTKCANNLRQIGIATIAYMTSPTGPNDRKGYMPHVRGLAEDDRPEDVGRVFEMLVRMGEIDDAEVFICPTSVDIPAASFIANPPSFTFSDHDVRTTMEFSYGWTRSQCTDGNARSSTVTAADRTAGVLGGTGAMNHPDGRNVLRFDGSVDFGPNDPSGAPYDPQLAQALANLTLADR